MLICLCTPLSLVCFSRSRKVSQFLGLWGREGVDTGQGRLVKLGEMHHFFHFCCTPKKLSPFVTQSMQSSVKRGDMQRFFAWREFGEHPGSSKSGGWVAQRPLTWHVFSIKNISTKLARVPKFSGCALIVWWGVPEYSLLWHGAGVVWHFVPPSGQQLVLSGAILALLGVSSPVGKYTLPPELDSRETCRKKWCKIGDSGLWG